MLFYRLFSSLLSTPAGHGGVPIRPVLDSKASCSSDTSPGVGEPSLSLPKHLFARAKTLTNVTEETTLFADTEKKTEETPEVAGDEFLDESLGSISGKNELHQTVKEEWYVLCVCR